MRRLVLIGYAGLAYAGFLAVVAWAIAFVAGRSGVPSIDSGRHVATGSAIAIDLLLLAIFAIHHSLMARPAAKSLLTRVIPVEAERSTYVLTADLLLALVFWQWRPVGGTVWEVTDRAARDLLWLGYAAGWAVAIASTFMIDHFDLVGLRQAASRDYRPRPFEARWLYALVRHPLMLGLLLAFWITPAMSAGHLLLAAAATAYVLVGTRFEEGDLRRTLGPEYAAYARRTPALVPMPTWGQRGRS